VGHFKVERKKRGQIAKIATTRKLPERIYHILKDGKTFHEMEKITESFARGEPGNSPGNA